MLLYGNTEPLIVGCTSEGQYNSQKLEGEGANNCLSFIGWFVSIVTFTVSFTIFVKTQY